MRVALVFLAALTTVGAVFATSAVAAPPAVVAAASATVGVAPFAVTLSAGGDAATYSWDFGDGTTGQGASVRHIYRPGRFVAVVTATADTGETAQAKVELLVRARTVTLNAPRAADYDSAISVRGTLGPAVSGGRVQIYRGRIYVTSARVARSGRFRATVRLRAPGPYHARYGAARSPERTVKVRPKLVTSLAPAAAVGSNLTVAARLVPPSAGMVRVEIRRGGRIVARSSPRGALRVSIPTAVAGDVRVLVASVPAPGFAAARRVLSTSVVLPSLGVGSSGPSVLALERRLAELRFALRKVDSAYAPDTFEAVLAFQKLHGLARTGRVDASLWGRLATASVPRPRYPGGTRIEVDKTRQLLFEIERGEVKRVVHVSTGATGNTPVGTWQVYRKVTGFDWVLWYPMYFLRGFAIHGYPSVPAYPASHGCVRVPMWIAPVLFAGHAYGATITVYV